MGNASRLQVRAQATGDKQTEHAEIAYQRPQGVGECGWAIPLDESMGRPSKGVTGKWHGQQRPSVVGDTHAQEHQGQARAYIMKGARGRFAVLAQVKRPEFAIRGDPFRHGHNPAVILLSKAAERSLPHLFKASQRFFVVRAHDHNLD